MPLFHRHPPKEPPTVHFPHNVSISTYPPSTTSQFSEYFSQIKKTAREPVSRKSALGGTIRTEGGGEVFESDAWAVEMPVTREMVDEAEEPREASIFRARIPAPSRAQVEAYQTYKEKAREVRARNNSEGVRVPSKIVSYDYACGREVGGSAGVAVGGEGGKVGELRMEPAGAWPKSPETGQRAWEMSGVEQATRRRTFGHGVDKSARLISDAAKMPIPRKPIGLRTSTPSRYPRDDSMTGASISPSPSPPPKIKLRLIPRAPPLQHQPPSPPRRSLLSTPSPPSSTTSRSSSSGKASPHFAYTTSASEQLKDINSTVFACTTGSKTPPTSPKRTFATLLRDREVRKREQSRMLANRWAWLRPSGPRVAKPVSTSPPTATATPAVTKATKTPPSPHTYISPFSPSPFLPLSSPTKLSRHPASPSPTHKFESGFAQITRVCTVVLKLLLLLYALVAVYFILDAVREAVYVVGAPFRVGKVVLGGVGRGVMGVWRGGGRAWERWGVSVVVRGDWGRWRGR